MHQQVINPWIDCLLGFDRVSAPINRRPEKISAMEIDRGIVVTRIGRAGEDRYTVNVLDNGIKLYGVFDGHAGATVAIALVKKLPSRLSERLASVDLNNHNRVAKEIIDSYLDLDKELASLGLTAGSTAIVALVVGNMIYMINLGDSKGLIVSGRKGVILETSDHKPGDPSEMQRIQQIGGNVIHSDTYRIDDMLAVSRSFGDFSLKKSGKVMSYTPEGWVSAVPDIYTYEIDSNDLYIILATDGLWDAFTADQVYSYLLTHSVEQLVTDAATKTTDDITVLYHNLTKH